jgi:NADH-quinone oxidoreductase subunit J
MIFLLTQNEVHQTAYELVDAKAVGIALFGPYLLVVELASLLLLGALVAAYHLGKPEDE